MPFGWWTAVLLLLPAVTLAQSGDGDTEPEISCTSHISTKGCSLTCELNRDDEDEEEEGDSIERITMCYYDLTSNKIKCLEAFGNTMNSSELHSLRPFNRTVYLKSGKTFTDKVDLKKIVKPRSPRVWNVTFNQETNQAVFHIQIPYNNDYIRTDNLLFQLYIWTAGSETTQEVSQKDTLEISMEHLQKDQEYHVRVRAKPDTNLQGSWSEWSETFSFSTPAEPEKGVQWETTYRPLIYLVPLVVLTFSVVYFWKNKIFTYMWPSIPHPKHTLVQICNSNKGLLLNLKPEVFSALKISPMEKATCEETEPSIAAAAAADGTNAPSSTQSSDCSRSNASVSTEESELLSRSSSDGEDSLQSSGPSPVDVPQLAERPRTPAPERSAGRNEPELFAVSQQEEAYVTMSSFYQLGEESRTYIY
ncbi:interleukin-7 receptor subunit alpha [Thunnus maccoyii]|uniref:interleukin-7 receptor subunit alpha n=1 Tax=Thunnus maccoyii TaxID=8240 RepID=UPI001C4BE067|nr:interleukin-7 receptor subunit alpha [Thunnus maccoyii]XP_042250863.1 interleukin-7 receptor subunit alpha [Thunnus maccoyii]XP_042250864.1 interleukin-7 receptor subunit alpha [Thunnus maccoyii]XP_042250865.1 interleukin-7 receptor subunit alpha [Thunnus maccoyii]